MILRDARIVTGISIDQGHALSWVLDFAKNIELFITFHDN